MKKLLLIIALLISGLGLNAQTHLMEGGEILLFEDFENYETGAKIAENGAEHWTTWSKKPGGAEDGVVGELDGNKYGHFTYGNDQILKLGGYTSGVFELEFDVYVPEGKGGFYNILHQFEGNTSWAVQAYFQMEEKSGEANPKIADGHGTVHAGSLNTYDVPCVYNGWMHFRVEINANIDEAVYHYTIPGSEEVEAFKWQWSKDCFGEGVVGRKLDAMNFFPPTKGTEFYVDNVILKKIGDDTAVIYYNVLAVVEPDKNAGIVTGTGIYEEGDTVTLVATSKNSYKFVNWTEDGEVVSTDAEYTIVVTKDLKLVANYKKTGCDFVEEDYQNARFVSTEQQYKNVFIEKFGTGYSTFNAPVDKTISQIISQYPEKVFAVDIHCDKFQPILSPNLCTKIGNDFVEAFNVNAYPSALINRLGESSSINVTTIEGQLEEEAKVNVGGQVLINPETRIATIIVETYYTKNDLYDTNYLTIMMSQDSILSDKSSNDPEQMLGNKYVHMHVLRDIVTSTMGDEIAPTTAGTLIARKYTYEIPEVIGDPNGVEVDLNNINFVAFVTQKKRGEKTSPILNVNKLSTKVAVEVNVTASVNIENAGVITGAGSYPIKETENVTLTATANAGYTFVNWTENGKVVSEDAEYTFTITNDRVLVANFIQTSVTYNVTTTVNPEKVGVVIGSGVYNEGDNVTLTAIPIKNGYEFVNWTEDGEVVSEDAQYSFVVEGNRNLVANFDKKELVETVTYNVTTTVNPEKVGVVIGSGLYFKGDNVTLTAIPIKNGYEFVNWTEDDKVVSEDAQYSFVIESDRELVANFVLLEYYVSAAVSSAEAGEVTGDGNYNHGDTVALVATANTGYKFVNWTEDGVVVSEDAEYSFVILKDRELTANFVETTGVEELSMSFNIYPNPVSDKLYIETQTQTLTVEIYDVYGRQQSMVNGQQSTVIDVSNLNSGVYFVKVVTSEGEAVKRFIKK